MFLISKTGGLKFYDRIEVKTILEYLRTISQPENNDALSRIINNPSRRIGETTIKTLLEEADTSRTPLWNLILGIIRGQRTTKLKLPKQTEQSLSTVVNIILTAQQKMNHQEPRYTIVQLIHFILEKTNYKKWLMEHHADINKGRWDNVQELITLAGDFEKSEYEDDSLPEIDGLEQNNEMDILPKFLANVALATEVIGDQDRGAPIAQITLSTIHSAKGLEWPVVFVPGAYHGSLPHSRAEDSNEERRLLYVAMTRAKAMLYMSFPMKNSQGENSSLSPFLEPHSVAALLSERGPSLHSSTINSIAQILRRPLPSSGSITNSAFSLRSCEDDLFPASEFDEDTDDDVTWRGNQKPIFIRGQQAPTRQKLELDQSSSIVQEGLGTASGTRNGSLTTMDRFSSFTAASTTLQPAFMSAGSHLKSLTEQYVNSAVGTAEKLNRLQTYQEVTSKKASECLIGQRTLGGFWGKTESHKRPAPTTNDEDYRKSVKISPQSSLVSNRDISQPRPDTTVDDPIAIASDLANHRLCARKDGFRPKQASHSELPRNDYVFLSSSPPKPNVLSPGHEAVPEKPPGLIAKPLLLPLIRPATTMHATTSSIAQGLLRSKKTLGVKRSMAGWSSGPGQPFRPPTTRRAI